MKNFFKGLAIIALVTLIGFSMTACKFEENTKPDNNETNNNNETNDNDGMYNVGNWWSWTEPSATATATHSVAADGVCTITIGGIPQVNNETDGWGRWKATAGYYYGDIAKAKTSYKYKFEAWTQSGNRILDVQYYNDNEAEGGQIRLHEEIQLTTVRKTYTIEGLSLPDTLPEPNNDNINLWFLGADKLGTFYVKIISITPLAGFSEGDDGGNIAVTLELAGMNEWELTEQSVQAYPNVDKTFTVTETYTSYQWYLDGVSVGTSQSYTLNKPAGVYQLVVVVTNSNGESRSGRCRVTVLN